MTIASHVENILMFMSHQLTSYSCTTLSIFQKCFYMLSLWIPLRVRQPSVTAFVFTVEETNTLKGNCYICGIQGCCPGGRTQQVLLSPQGMGTQEDGPHGYIHEQNAGGVKTADSWKGSGRGMWGGWAHFWMSRGASDRGITMYRSLCRQAARMGVEAGNRKKVRGQAKMWVWQLSKPWSARAPGRSLGWERGARGGNPSLGGPAWGTGKGTEAF